MSWKSWKSCILIGLLCGGLFFISAGAVSKRVAFPSSFDESFHLSFIKEMHELPRLFVRPGELRLLDTKTHLVWTEKTNPLSHPTFYYNLTAGLVGAWDTARAIDFLRLINTIIATLAVLVAVISFRFLLADDKGFVIASVLVALTPKAAVMAGMINNDNLAYLGGAIALGGMAVFTRRPASAAAALCLGGGTAIGFLSKLPGGMLLAVLCLAYVALYFRRNPRRLTAAWPFFVVFFGLILIGLAPYIFNLISFGNFIHVVDEWHIRAARELNWPALSLSGFFLFFFGHIAIGWSSNSTLVATQIIAPGLLLGLLVWGGIGRSRTLKLAEPDINTNSQKESPMGPVT